MEEQKNEILRMIKELMQKIELNDLSIKEILSELTNIYVEIRDNEYVDQELKVYVHATVFLYDLIKQKMTLLPNVIMTDQEMSIMNKIKIMCESNFTSDEWLKKGLSFYNTGEFKEALECYNKALELEPDFTEAWFRKGMVIGVLGDYEEAIKCHDKALELDPEFVSGWLGKGMALSMVGNHREAIKCYNYLLKINPAFKDAWVV